MDGQLALALAAGIPALFAAIGYAVKKHADSRATNASAEKDRAEARKIDAEGRRLIAETTGKFGTDALARIEEMEAEIKSLRETVEKLRKQLSERDAALGALMVELAKLHDAIASSTDPVFRRFVRAAERFLAALTADGWKATTGTERSHMELQAALKEAREAV